MDTLQHKQYKILLIGDSCTDVYVLGNCLRLSPEAPVPVFTKESKDSRLGMSSNVYSNIKSISKNIVTHVTNDESRIKKIRFIDSKSKHQIMRYDIEKEISSISAADLPSGNFDAILISDYDKGLIDKSLPPAIRKKYSCPIFVDTKKQDLSIYDGCVIKVNESEFDSAINTEGLELIVTLGPSGAKMGDVVYPTDKVDVHDVCGAGDVFLAGLVVRWLETNDMPSAIKTANRCAAHSVTKPGTYSLSRQEYEDLRV